jgi:dynein heavy chain
MQDKIKRLQEQLDVTMLEQERLKKELDELFSNIERGDSLVKGLANEKERWQQSLANYGI